MSAWPKIITLIAASGVNACVAQVAQDSVARGEELYMDKCAACHGQDGTGGGPTSLGLGAPPPGLTLLSQRNGGDFPRDYVMSTIDGFSRRGHPEEAMPEFGREDLGPLVMEEFKGISTPVPADLVALAAYIQSIQK